MECLLIYFSESDSPICAVHVKFCLHDVMGNVIKGRVYMEL